MASLSALKWIMRRFISGISAGMSNQHKEVIRMLNEMLENQNKSAKDLEENQRLVREVLEHFERQGGLEYDQARLSNDANDELASLQAEIDEERKKSKQLVVKINYDKERIQQWKERDAERQENIDHISQQLEVNKRELELAQDQVRAMQAHALNQVQSGWNFEEDSTVCQIMESFYADVRAWAKQYCFNSFSGASGEYLLRLASELKSCAFGHVEFLEHFEHPYLLVAAALSDHLRTRIFDTPFFLLSNSRKSVSRYNGRNLDEIFKSLAQGKF